MKLLKQLYEIHSPSGKELRLANFIERYIAGTIPGAYLTRDKIGNLFICKGQSETYPCVVAHLDQVQRKHSKDFRAVETRDIIFGYSPSKRRYEGLGADDKNGIWISLKCLAKFEDIKVAFFVGEEVGCVGSNAADLSFFSDCRFVIQPDRRGSSDLITQISWEDLCSEEFLAEIDAPLFGYKPTDGLMTDIEILRGNGLELSCVNVSCGYYDPHTDNEFTVKEDLLNSLAFVEHIIKNCTKTYSHESKPYFNDFYNDPYEMYDYCVEMIDEIIAAHPDYTIEDAWEVFEVNFPGLPMEDFEALYEDAKYSYDLDRPIVAQPKRRSKGKSKKRKALPSTRTYTFFHGSRWDEDDPMKKSA